MEEKMTLEELNQEYRDLVNTTAGYKQGLENLKKERETTSDNLGRAEDDFSAKKEKYESLSAQLGETKGFSEGIVAQMQAEVDKAKIDMENAQALVAERQKEDDEKSTEVSKLQEKAKLANDRMNLILVSFGANETINKALVNELEIDYGEKIEEKEEKQKAIDEVKTEISEDPKIQESLTQLSDLLKQYEDVRAAMVPGDSKGNKKKLDAMDPQISRLREKIKRQIKSKMKEHDLSTSGKISASEIDAMIEQKDDKGRFVIPELDRQIALLDSEIGKLAGERESIKEAMKVSLEVAKNVENGNPEYQKVSQEVSDLSEEIKAAVTQKEESQRILEEIPAERAKLEAELEAIKNSNPNVERIAELQAELDKINAEVVPEIDNQEIARIQAEIKKLEAQGITGAAKVETQEYKDAKKALDDAEKALEDEKKINYEGFFVTKPNYKKDDSIIENPDYTSAKAEVDVAQKDLDEFNEGIKDSELEDLKVAAEEAEKESQDASQEHATAQKNLEDKKKELAEKHISKEDYKSFENPDSDLSKAFAEYEAKELAVRKAMLALQKEQTKANKAAYEQAMSEYKTAEQDFQKKLFIEGGVEPTSEAMHNFLMNELNNRDKTELAEEYNLEMFENRLAIAAKSSKNNIKDEVEKLKDTSGKLLDLMTKALKGENVTPEEFDAAYDEHKLWMEDLEPEDIDIIIGEGLPEPPKNFFAKLFARRMPKPKYDYAFEDIEDKAGEEIKPLEEALKEAEDKKKEKADNAKEAKKAYDEKYKEVITPEQEAKKAELENKLKVAQDELRAIPEKINKTARERLTAALEAAKAKLGSTKQYEDTVDVSKQIADLKDKLAKEPKKVVDPKAKEAKENKAKAKQKEIDDLGSQVDTTKVTEVKDKIAELIKKEEEEKSKLANAEKTITEKTPIFDAKKAKLKVLEFAKNFKNLIHIKDAKKISDRRSGSIGQDLADATKAGDVKKKVEEDERDF